MSTTSLDVAVFSRVERVLEYEQRKFDILKVKKRILDKESQNANPKDFKFTKQQQDVMKGVGITEKLQKVLKNNGVTSVGTFTGITKTDLIDAGIPLQAAGNFLKVKSQFMDAREQVQAVTSEIVEGNKIAIKNIKVIVHPILAMTEDAKESIEARIETVNQHIDQRKQKQIDNQNRLSKITSDKTKAKVSLADSNTKVSNIEKEIKDVKHQVEQKQNDIYAKQKTMKASTAASIATGVTGGVLAIFTLGASLVVAAATAGTSAVTIASLEIAKAVLNGEKNTLANRLKKKQTELHEFTLQRDNARKDVKRLSTSIFGLQKAEVEQKKELERLQAIHAKVFATLTSTKDLLIKVEQLTTDVSYYYKTVLQYDESNGKLEVPYDKWISRVHRIKYGMFDLAETYTKQLAA